MFSNPWLWPSSTIVLLQWFTSWEIDMNPLRDTSASETRAVQIPAGWFAANVRPWFSAACGGLVILTHREALRLLMFARQLGY